MTETELLTDALADACFTIHRSVGGHPLPLWVLMPAEERTPWLAATEAFYGLMKSLEDKPWTFGWLEVEYAALNPLVTMPGDRLPVGAVVRFLVDFYARREHPNLKVDAPFNWREWVAQMREMPCPSSA